MSEKEEENFTFTWLLRNFSMCPVQMGDTISSPIFRVSKCQNSDWSLLLYPKGVNIQGSIGCYLCCKRLDANQSTINIKFSLCVASDIKKSEHTFKLSEIWGDSNFVLEDFPKDTLMIKCTMNCENLLKDDIPKPSKNNDLYRNQSCIETTIPVEINCVIWTIQRFKSLSCNNVLVLPVSLSVKEIPSFYVELYKTVESPSRIQIKRSQNDSYGKLYIKCHCRISVIDVNDSKYRNQDDFLFKTVDDVWTFPPFFQLSSLEKDRYFESTNGMLHLQFDFAFSVDGRMRHSEKQDGDQIFLPTKSQLPVKLFELTTDDEQSIVTFKAGDHLFKVHKSLLEFKSEKFHEMFESTGVVNITDVDPYIVAQMLQFIYFRTIDDLCQSDAAKLYAFGDKYQVKSLVSHCSSVLVSLLSESNVCDILDLADLHQDQWLLTCALDFFASRYNSILDSKEWKEFSDRSVTLAEKILDKVIERCKHVQTLPQ